TVTAYSKIILRRNISIITSQRPLTGRRHGSPAGTDLGCVGRLYRVFYDTHTVRRLCADTSKCIYPAW
ncbi:MAG: hypothetical protein LBI14_01500, partial [Treponema sp.]|nr:hypothetical protein [Treponema sp.]